LTSSVADFHPALFYCLNWQPTLSSLCMVFIGICCLELTS